MPIFNKQTRENNNLTTSLSNYFFMLQIIHMYIVHKNWAFHQIFIILILLLSLRAYGNGFLLFKTNRLEDTWRLGKEQDSQ